MSSSELYKGGSPAVTNPPSKALNNVFSFAWLACGILTVLIPLIFRTLKMNNYKNMYYMYNWEEAQQDYQEQQEQYYQQYSENNYAQEYGQGNYQYQWEQMQGSYDINQCKWYQLNCFPYYINENGEPEPSAGWVSLWEDLCVSISCTLEPYSLLPFRHLYFVQLMTACLRTVF